LFDPSYLSYILILLYKKAKLNKNIKMNDKEICRRIIGNRRAMLARQLAENSALSNLAHSALFHNNNSMGRNALFNNSPLLSSILANALVQIMISKVDKGTQTLLRIPTKPDFYIRYFHVTIYKISSPGP
jgi:hypothetical protein